MTVALAATIPMFDLRPVIARAAGTIQANLAAMHEAGQYIQGEQVVRFEEEIASSFGARLAVGCGSGTSALELSLRAAGVTNACDEVLVPANTSLFTAQAVLAAGARLRVADVDPATLLLTREMAERAMTDKVRAVIAVHLFGRAAALDELAELCERRGIVLIQDSCQAHGLRFLGRPLTDYSDYVAYSFYPTKNLGCLGDGGAVLTNSALAADRLRLLRDGGRAGGQVARVPAVNSRLDEIHACYLRGFLPHLDYWTGHRRRIAAAYNALLVDSRCARAIPAEASAVHHLYVIRAYRRELLREHLAAQGILTAVHYPTPLHQHPGFAGRLSIGEEPVHAIAASREILSLPIGPHISEQAARYVAEEVLRHQR